MFKFCIQCGVFHEIGDVIVTDLTPEDLAGKILAEMSEVDKDIFIIDWFVQEFVEDPEFFNRKLQEYNVSNKNS